ncbi:tetratricopeptide repeat protein [candidate division WWE3 bacterium]|nr:tetratricopeptide repeat protein [candidate division WWE3 bacterium]
MQDKKTTIIESLLDVFPKFLAFLVPIFFLPITSEFFEFNKLALITVATIFMLIVWLAKMITNKKVEITKSPLDLPFLMFLIVTILATVFSLHKVSSIFGSLGRWFPSLFSTLVLAFFYYVTSSNLSSTKAIRGVINGIVLSTTFVSFIAILSYFGVIFGTSAFFQIPNFTTTGSSEVVALLAVIGLILALSNASSQTKTTKKVALIPTIMINFVAIVLMGTVAVWITLGVGLIVLAFLSDIKVYMQNKGVLFTLLGFCLLVVTVLTVPATRNILINENYPSEIRISAKESWIVTSSVLRDFPILGTGPSTFVINYNRYKPVSVNDRNYWEVRFDKPFSELFSIIASMGIVGLVATLALTFKVLKYCMAAKSSFDEKELTVGIGTAIIAMVVAFGFTYASVTTGFLLVLLLAALVAKYRIDGTNDTENVNLSLSSISKGNKMSLINTDKEVFQYIMAVPITLVALAGSYYMFRQYEGEFYTRSAIAAAQENNGSLTYQLQQKAIEAFPMRDSYHNSYANTNIALANSLASKETLSDEEKNTIQTLIAQAIRSTKVTTEVLNPLNAANWETRALVYRSLQGVAKDANDWAIKSLNAAIQLDPVNPRLRLALGGIYYAQSDFLSAANLFSQAVTLKNDYANAHYNLAQSLRELKKYPEAIQELEFTKKLVDEKSEDYTRVAAEIENLSKMPNVAGATSQPSVADIEGTNNINTQAPVNQAPLEDAGSNNPLEISN